MEKKFYKTLKETGFEKRIIEKEKEKNKADIKLLHDLANKYNFEIIDKN